MRVVSEAPGDNDIALEMPFRPASVWIIVRSTASTTRPFRAAVVPSLPVHLVLLAARESTTTLRHAVMEALSGPTRDVVLDLRGVLSMSNLDVGVLVGARARQRARGGRLSLIFDSRSATDEALSRTGLRGSFHSAVTPGPGRLHS